MWKFEQFNDERIYISLIISLKYNNFSHCVIRPISNEFKEMWKKAFVD